MSQLSLYTAQFAVSVLRHMASTNSAEGNYSKNYRDCKLEVVEGSAKINQKLFCMQSN